MTTWRSGEVLQLITEMWNKKRNGEIFTTEALRTQRRDKLKKMEANSIFFNLL